MNRTRITILTLALLLCLVPFAWTEGGAEAIQGETTPEENPYNR